MVHDPAVQIGLSAARKIVQQVLFLNHAHDRQVHMIVPIGHHLVALDLALELLAEIEAVRVDMPYQVEVAA